MKTGLLGVLAGVWATVAVAAAEPMDIPAARARLQRILHENIVPFWGERVIDRQHGGYRLNHGVDGAWLGPADKALVTQARTVWFFSRLYNAGYGDETHLEAARHGFVFLRDRLWDAKHGGFFWSVSADGSRPLQAMKHLYGQGFGLYALVEYGRASGDPRAAELAAELFGLLEFYAYDRHHGGYREFFARDWGRPPEGSPSYVGEVPVGTKLMNTHLHLMEPFTTYLAWSGRPLVRQRLQELVFIMGNAVVRTGEAACTDKYTRDWTPLLQGPWGRVSYGHDIENVWLLSEANRAALLPDAPLLQLYRALVDNALLRGFDHEAGGFYDGGPLGGPADDLDKTWWVQAEGLVALLHLYERTGEEPYARAFMQTLDWIETRQVDWENGDWFSTAGPEGGTGNKAGPWKSPYHNGRAVIECLERLERLERREK